MRAKVGNPKKLAKDYDSSHLQRIPLRELEYLVQQLEDDPDTDEDIMAQQMLATIQAEIDRRHEKHGKRHKHDVQMFG